MAINVNTVYRTVLLLLNKEQRGYMTPAEFNSVARQVQLEIFEEYFEDINQQLRVPQADVDYADRVASVDEKMSIFKKTANPDFAVDSFALSTISNIYKIGTVVYNNDFNEQVELDRLSRSTFYNIQRSKLTASTKSFPTYLYEDNKIFVSPNTIKSNGDISVNYLQTPLDPQWNFTVGSLGQYNFNLTDAALNPSRNFELAVSEQTTVILKVLLYAGLIIKDPSVIQVAAQQVQSQEINKKS